MKQRIWFNHWFSTAYHIINLIKNNPDNVAYEVYGTNRNPNSVALLACDYREVEPTITTIEDYLDYALDFCRKHRINIFIPRHCLVELAAYAEEFAKIGTQVLVTPNYQLLQRISNKDQLYKECQAKQLAPIPQYQVVDNIESFLEAYEEITASGRRVCFKPVSGEGGMGFRVIAEEEPTYRSLYGYANSRISLREARRLLASVESFESLMVSEYLEGYEYSIDCLAYQGELLAVVPRKKVESRIRFLEENRELLELSQRLLREYPLDYIFNIQVKYDQNGVPKLLEINPRMSGGLYVSCQAGINFPYQGVKLLTTGAVGPISPLKFDISTAQIEEICLVK